MDKTINTIDTTYTQPNQEKVELTLDEIDTVKKRQKDFGIKVTDRMTRETKYWNLFQYDTRREINRKYYFGDQVKKSSLRDDQEKGVENAIFRNIETIVPIATSRTPEVTATPAYKNTQTRQYAMGVRRSLQSEWEVYQGMQQQVSEGIRNHQINFLAIFQLGYDPDTDEFWTEQIPATDVVVSKNGDFLAKYIKNETLGDLLDRFPEKEKEILESLKYGTTATDELRASPVVYIEAWTHKVVGWKLNDVVLGVEDNPHFDYTGQKTQVPDQQGQQVEVTVKYNHFHAPRMPFIFLTYFSRGIHLLDETTLIEQGIGLQDWINKRKRQIGENADSTNGHWVSSGDFISQEEFNKIQGGIDEKIWLESGMPSDGLSKITGTAMPDFVYNDLLDSRQALDNLMGTHATTRGEQTNNKTLGQDLMQKDQDYGRVDGYVRDGIEVLAQDWYEYMYHLYLVYRTEDKSIAIPADDDFEDDNVIFSQARVPLIRTNKGDVIPVPMILRVKQGSTLPLDDVAEYQRAVQMKDILSPVDYFRKVGEPNPKELAKNYLIWVNDPFQIYKDDKDIQQLLQSMAAKAQVKPPISVSVRADATTPQGAAILEKEGILPPGAAAAAAQQLVLNPSPGPGSMRNTTQTMLPNQMTDQPPAEQPADAAPAPEGDQKQRLVNAMTDMLRNGEAQQIIGGAPPS